MAAATGASSTMLQCKLECRTIPRRPASSLGSNCYAARFPFASSDLTSSTALGRYHYHDFTAVRRVANTNEHSDDVIASPGVRKWRGSANGFGKLGRAVPMTMSSWAPELLLVNETNEECRMEFLERVGEYGADLHTFINTYKKRFTWSLFRPRQVTFSTGGKLSRKVRKIVNHLILSAQPVVHSLDFYSSPKGLGINLGSRKQEERGNIPNAASISGDRNSCEREVRCQVEAVSWRERHISASVRIEASEERVWEVLTDYGRLAEFIPNLTRSEQIPCPHPGRTWLLQEGRQATMYWQIEARVVLDLEELPDVKDGKELRFSMVDGDFKRYVGRWYLRPDVRTGTTILHYEVNVTPRLLFPAAFVERIIMSDLPTNLRAMAERAEDCTNLSQVSPVQADLGASLLSPRVLQKTGVSSTTLRGSIATGAGVQNDMQLTVTGPMSLSYASSSPVGLKEKTRLGDRDYPWGSIGKTCKLGKPCAVDEVHLRRFDDLLENGGVHRRVVAAITVEAPAHNVWSVLTAYENLPKFIPNLAICEVLSRDKNRVRLLQEGCKCLLYMVLHARVVLDLWERPEYEIMFQQVEGDFDSFQGKWTLEPLGAQHTLLKYLVDTKMHKDSLLAEALVEEVIYEDLPANLCAIRDQVEVLEVDPLQGSSVEELESNDSLDSSPSKENHPSSPTPFQSSRKEEDIHEVNKSVWKASPRTRKRPLVAGLQHDFNVLKQELLQFMAEKGTEGVMPLRCELRDAGRVDLEKAIARNGGFGPVATKLNLSLAYKERKPRGYWDNLQNIHNEILLFQREHGKDGTYMPTRQSLERAGRYDLARSLEKWGGLREVARVLGLHVKKRQRIQIATDILPSQSDKAIIEDETDLKLPLKTALPPKSTKWVNMRRGASLEPNDH